MKAFLFAAFTLALLVSTVYGSSGDRSPEFQNCLSTCYGDHCHPWTALPVDLRLTRWTCTDDCKYQCMHMLTDKAIELGQDIQQYYGKWPFWRFLGMQEPASVAFSLWNMWFHLQGARQVRRRISMNHPFRGYYLIWAYASVNTWIWSTVFHTRGEQRLSGVCFCLISVQIYLSQRGWIIFQLLWPSSARSTIQSSAWQTCTLHHPNPPTIGVRSCASRGLYCASLPIYLTSHI